MTLPISTWTSKGIGLDVSCKCGKWGYVPASVANEKLDTDMSLALAAHHLVCTGCGAKGGAILVRFSIGDFYDSIGMRAAATPNNDKAPAGGNSGG